MELFLEVSEELGHKMDVLEHQPKTFFEGLGEFGNGLFFHLGSERNLEVLLIHFRETKLLAKGNHVCCWVGTLRQNEEDWDTGIALDRVESVLQDLGE